MWRNGISIARVVGNAEKERRIASLLRPDANNEGNKCDDRGYDINGDLCLIGNTPGIHGTESERIALDM